MPISLCPDCASEPREGFNVSAYFLPSGVIPAAVSHCGHEQGPVPAMNLETTEEELMHTVFPHPTLSEMMHESVLDAYGRVIHT